jgi:hypothetical protein
MANLSTLVGLGVKSLKTGYLSNVTTTSGDAGTEYATYKDVPIATVDRDKCICFFQGGGGATNTGMIKASASVEVYEQTARVTTTTNLQIACRNANSTHITGRWYVVEFY